MWMKFIIRKEDLFNGIKIVERATSQKAVQPVLYNILIETLDNNAIRLTATDLVLTVITTVDAQIEQAGKITLPAKKLNEIVSKLGNELVTFEVEEGSTNVNISCKKSKFDIIGISASEFPPEVYNYEIDETKCFDVELKPFLKAIKQAGFAAASYEVSNLLSGIVCDFSNGILEIASTDGNRLARVREKLASDITEQTQLIIPSRTLNEFMKMGSFIDDETIKICKDKSTIVLKTEKTLTISRLLEGQFPKYNQLIPSESPKQAIVNVSQLISALERVSVMVNDKTSIVKMLFADNELTLSADTPDSGKSEDKIDIQYTAEELLNRLEYQFKKSKYKANKLKKAAKAALIETEEFITGTDLIKVINDIETKSNIRINNNTAYVNLYNNIYANKEIRSFMAMNFVTRGRVKKLKKAKNNLESYISKKKHLKNENRLTPNEEHRLNLLIRATQEQIKYLEDQILSIKNKPVAKKRYDYFLARLKKSMTDAREKATKKYEEAKIFKLLKKETQELKSNISNTNEQIPEPKILKLIQEINIKEPQKAIEKIIQIKNLIPEEFQKQKEKAQNQNIKNEEHKKAVQRQDKER